MQSLNVGDSRFVQCFFEISWSWWDVIVLVFCEVSGDVIERKRHDRKVGF